MAFKRKERLLSVVLQNKRFSGQLTSKEAFYYLMRYKDNLRSLLNAVPEEFTSKEHDTLLEIFATNTSNEEEKLEKFQTLFEMADHRDFLRAMWMHRWLLTGITENCGKGNECANWMNRPVFEDDVPGYLIFLLVYSVYTGLFWRKNFFFSSKHIGEDCGYPFFDVFVKDDYNKFDYYSGWLDIIKESGRKIIDKAKDWFYDEQKIINECTIACNLILTSGLVNNIVTNNFTANFKDKYMFGVSLNRRLNDAKWLNMNVKRYIHECSFETPLSEKEINDLNKLTIEQLMTISEDYGIKKLEIEINQSNQEQLRQAYEKMKDYGYGVDFLFKMAQCKYYGLKEAYKDKENGAITYMGQYVIMCSNLMLEVYNQVKDVLGEDERQELLLILKQGKYTNCLLPYYVDDDEPTDTHEDHPLSTTDIDKSDDRPLLDNSLPQKLQKEGFIAAEEKATQEEMYEQSENDLHFYCQKAIQVGFLMKKGDGYQRTKSWTKIQLAYFLQRYAFEIAKLPIFPDKEYSSMFNEQRLGKSASDILNNKLGGGKPRGYEQVDKLFT